MKLHSQFAPSLLWLRPLLIVAVVAALAGHYLDQSGRLAPVPRASIGAPRIDVTPDGASAAVVLRVGAGDEDLGPLSVFWIVSLPDTAQPWDAPRYVAPAQTVDSLKAGSTVDLMWRDAQLTMPIGRYDITGWVHAIVAPGVTEHLAGGYVGSFSITHDEPQSQQFGAGWFTDPAGPLVLQKLSIAQTAPETQTVSVEATILNRGDQAVAGRVFWVIGRFTDPEPYRAPFWQTPALAIPMLAPGASQVLSWTQSVGLPAGTYGLSVWVHAEGPDGFQHSHSSLNLPLTLGPDPSNVQRHDPPGPLQVASATLPAPGVVRVLVDNQGPDSSVSLAAELVADGRRYDSYQDFSQPNGPLLDVSIPGRAQRTIDVPVGIECRPDSALVRIRLYASAADPPVDDVLVDACP